MSVSLSSMSHSSKLLNLRKVSWERRFVASSSEVQMTPSDFVFVSEVEAASWK